jgi:putative ABC transport system permease protein
MDIGAAQQTFERIGLITRVALDLLPGADTAAFVESMSSQLPPGVVIETPQAATQANARLTRAYRINLNVLALVALFTGGLLVFSTQAASIVRRRAQLALLRVIGVTRKGLLGLLLAEGACVGLLGAGLGLLLGIGLAEGMLRLFGADLGAEYFRDREARLNPDPVSLMLFLALGVLTAILGTLAPALDAGRIALAHALKADGDGLAFERLKAVWPGVLLLAVGSGLAWQPAIMELPIGGYASIALLLFGSLLLVPRLLAVVARCLPSGSIPWIALATARLRRASAHLSIGLAALVAAIGLAVAMAIMVASFRASLDDWLEHMLPADVYVRAAPTGDTAYFDTDTQARLAELPGVRRAEFLRTQHIVVDATRPRVTLIARDLSDPERQIPLVKGTGERTSHAPNAWVSEHMSDVFGWQPGDYIELPLAGKQRRFVVAGIWRDYARQNGAVLIERHIYRAITGDEAASDAALWLSPGTDAVGFKDALRALAGGSQLEIAQPDEIREWSLAIFDRTFAVTYALEAVAVAIGLAGLSASFASNAFARRREFGMLKHIGMSGRQIASMLAYEGLVIAAVAALAGLLLGWVISLLLVHVVNRQAFHWSMDMHYPVTGIAVFLLSLIALAATTALVSGRAAMSGEAVRAVKEDW